MEQVMSKTPSTKAGGPVEGRTCRACGKAKMTSGEETYDYRECGLPNVVLVGVVVRRCPSCGHHELVLPRITELHRTIALAVIHKRARLSGAEVRFLRKSLGWSGVDFARHIGVDPSTVSNWENDKDPIGASSDRLLRLMVAHGAPVDEYPLEELTKIENERTPPVEVRLSPKARGWRLVEAA
jgi:putative zinc finger/helix-turn-helix YgiT family protein